MRIDFEKLSTEFLDVTVGLKNAEIDALIAALHELKERKGHFHFRGDLTVGGGLSDIEFYWAKDDQKDNAELDTGQPIEGS